MFIFIYHPLCNRLKMIVKWLFFYDTSNLKKECLKKSVKDRFKFLGSLLEFFYKMGNYGIIDLLNSSFFFTILRIPK